ncbi:MAG TPA: hypothetical protein VJH96_00615 [Patescibacteria group bacterium]|nr:hypothetical protein [Patescibacteria group bacterium]
MGKTDYALFLGKEHEQYITECIAEGGCFLVFAMEKGDASTATSKEDIHRVLKNIAQKCIEQPIQKLSDFVLLIDSHLASYTEHGSFSVSAACVSGNVLYLATRGGGKIFLTRGDVCEVIIHGSNQASGYPQPQDFFVLTTEAFSTVFPTEKLHALLAGSDPRGVVEAVTAHVQNAHYSSLALFLFFKKETEESEIEEFPRQTQTIPPPIERGYSIIKKSQSFSKRRKAITFIIVIILLVVFIWSVVFGYKRRAHAKLVKQVGEYEARIEDTLTKAQDSASINLEQSLSLIDTAQKDLEEIKKKIGEKKFDVLDVFTQKIIDEKQKLLKREDKMSEEFYDLALIKKEAVADTMYKEGDIVALLNAQKGEVYLLSLSEKSTETIKSEQMKNASRVALYNDKVFFFKKGDGVYLQEKGGAALIVAKDENDWGSIQDMSIYNGNIYLLGSEKDEIYKYTPVSETEFAKTSYFKQNEAVDLEDSISMAIDASIYILTPDKVYKYTSGVHAGFTTNFPDAEHSFLKIFTDADSQKVYILDRGKQAVMITSKEGTYEKQITAAVLADADDFIADEGQKSLFVLKDNKLYKIPIE